MSKTFTEIVITLFIGASEQLYYLRLNPISLDVC